MHSWVPALLAVAAALLIAAGTVLRQRASRASGAITAGWWVGAAIALLGFTLQASALGLGSILLVQPLVVLAVLFALPLEAWADHRRPARIEWTWGGVLVACVATFLLVAHPEPSMRRPEPLVEWITFASIAVVPLVLVWLAERSSPHYRALFYGLTAGILFGVSALLVKGVIYQLTHAPFGMFLRPEIYLFVVVVIGAIVAQQKGFGAGDLQTSFPAMTVMEPAVAMVLGVILLGENLKVSVMTAVFLGVVLAVMVRAVIELAKLSAIRGYEEAVIAEEQAAEEQAAQEVLAEELAAEVEAVALEEAALEEADVENTDVEDADGGEVGEHGTADATGESASADVDDRQNSPGGSVPGGGPASCTYADHPDGYAADPDSGCAGTGRAEPGLGRADADAAGGPAERRHQASAKTPDGVSWPTPAR
ncbi:hypothetical protein GS4_11_01500 [Gordonia soli NBRC 108243]|uniref:Uncharacterized protein n=1 Tax=Gordonia soli NBRC 108243 TaxID=1223545 RepID=M0QHX8_9ACTN|nr:hypothetical protein GS4_11_01500 [Gordonia soli NBRC 108243]